MGTGATLMLRYSAGLGPLALEAGALKQVAQRHGGLTDIHVDWVNVPFRHSRHWSVTFLRTRRGNLEAVRCTGYVCLHAGFSYKLQTKDFYKKHQYDSGKI